MPKKKKARAYIVWDGKFFNVHYNSELWSSHVLLKDAQKEVVRLKEKEL